MDALEPCTGRRGARARLARPIARVLVPAIGALALWGLAPAVASAQDGWRLNGTQLGGPLATSWSGKVKVVDSKTIAGVLSLECEDTVEGSSGIAGFGEVTKLTASKCGAAKVCESGASNTIEPLNLPWYSTLTTVEGTIRDVISGSGKGAPGLAVHCKVLGVKTVDECSGTLSLNTKNTESGVSATFNAGEKLNCTDGEVAGSGSVEGSQSLTATGGGKLSAESEAERRPVWLEAGKEFTGAKEISWTGTITLKDQVSGHGELAVRCQDSGIGTAGGSGPSAGAMSSWTLTSCVNASGSSSCEEEGGDSIKALNLAWDTELGASGGAVHNAITSSGKGTPGFVLKCRSGGITLEDECAAVPSTTMTNTTSGVVAAFENKKFTCSLGKAEAGQLEGSQTIKLKNEALLHVS